VCLKNALTKVWTSLIDVFFTFKLSFKMLLIQSFFIGCTFFNDVVGGKFRLLDGSWIPRMGFRCSEQMDQDHINEMIKTALTAGYRLFDYSHFEAGRQEVSNALKVTLFYCTFLFCLSSSNCHTFQW
jgi:hypothetical protein